MEQRNKRLRVVYNLLMPACRACRDPRRDQIDQQLLGGVPLRTICAQTGLSLGGLSRHRDHLRQTLSLALKERTPDESREQGSALLQRVTELVTQAEEILAAAKLKNDFRGANGALGAAAKLLDLCARLSGELQSANAGGLHLHKHVINVTNYNYDNDVDFAAMIGEATKGFSYDELMRLKRVAEGASVQPPCNAIPNALIPNALE